MTASVANSTSSAQFFTTNRERFSCSFSWKRLDLVELRSLQMNDSPSFSLLIFFEGARSLHWWPNHSAKHTFLHTCPEEHNFPWRVYRCYSSVMDHMRFGSISTVCVARSGFIASFRNLDWTSCREDQRTLRLKGDSQKKWKTGDGAILICMRLMNFGDVRF